MSTFTLALVQTSCGEEREKNIAQTSAKVRQAAERGAEIICLQELFSSTYFCTSEDPAKFDMAEPVDGPTVHKMQGLALTLGVVIVVPFFERRAPGIYHNSAAVVDADGSLSGVYRKMHIPDDPLYYEKFYFTPGDMQPPMGGFRIFKTKYADIGVLICWDQWYPEAARITSLMGAEVLIYPTAIGWHPSEKEQFGTAQWQAWQTIQRSHAIANGVYVAAVNRVGHEATAGTDGLEFFGRSFVSDPFGRIVAEAKEKEEMLIVKCDRTLLEETRRLWPFLRDRRVDAYLPITSRYLDRSGG